MNGSTRFMRWLLFFVHVDCIIILGPFVMYACILTYELVTFGDGSKISFCLSLDVYVLSLLLNCVFVVLHFAGTF